MKIETKVQLISENFREGGTGKYQAVIYVTSIKHQRFTAEKIRKLEPRLVVEAAFHDVQLNKHLRFPCFHVLVVNFSQLNKNIESFRRFCQACTTVVTFDDDRAKNQTLDSKAIAALKTLKRVTFESEEK